jgi:hypothetical protein
MIKNKIKTCCTAIHKGPTPDEPIRIKTSCGSIPRKKKNLKLSDSKSSES